MPDLHFPAHRGDNGYGKMAEAMRLAGRQPGFLGIESARDGLGITVSYWASLDAIAAGKANATHPVAQQHGSDTWYENFKVRICRVSATMPSCVSERLKQLHNSSIASVPHPFRAFAKWVGKQKPEQIDL